MKYKQRTVPRSIATLAPFPPVKRVVSEYNPHDLIHCSQTADPIASILLLKENLGRSSSRTSEAVLTAKKTHSKIECCGKNC